MIKKHTHGNKLGNTCESATTNFRMYKKVQVGKDQEKAQSEKRFPLQKPRWEKTKLTIRYLYDENIS